MPNEIKEQVSHKGSGEGKAVWLLGDLYTFKLDSEETGGAFALWETVAPVGHAGPPPHVHLRESETFMVLEGELEIHRDGDPIIARSGSIVHVPAGALHFFRNTASHPARFLVMVSPGGFERFFKEVGEPASGGSEPPVPQRQPDVERITALARKYHCEISPPPEH